LEFGVVLKIASLLSGLALAGCSVVGIRSGTEEPKFTLRGLVGAVEIRDYAPRVAAEVAVSGDEDSARNQGFRKLAGYIFGGNRTKATIAMTAPVAQASAQIAMTAPVTQTKDAAGRWVIRFFMPAGSTLQTLPVPDDADVHLVEVPAETWAVLRFTGSRSPDAVAQEQAALAKALSGSPYRPVGGPQAWFYDPPWTLPPFRRNEAAVRVEGN
jgi:hypothetical protein